jgi:hypothetical protein
MALTVLTYIPSTPKCFYYELLEMNSGYWVHEKDDITQKSIGKVTFTAAEGCATESG